jgi:hypothetical protein
MRRHRRLIGLAAGGLVVAVALITSAPNLKHLRAVTHGLPAPAAKLKPTVLNAAPGRQERAQGLEHLSPIIVVRAFAHAYARYLGGGGQAGLLPFTTAAVRATIRQTGPIPARGVAGVTSLAALGEVNGPDPGSQQIALTIRNAKHGFRAEITLGYKGGWRVTTLVPPDYDSILGPPPYDTAPTGPASVRAAASSFTRSYVAYTYGHAGAGKLEAVDKHEQAALAANPPIVRSAIRSLKPRIESMTLKPSGGGWSAFADVSDGEESYWLISDLRRIGGRWLVVYVQPAG